MYYSYNSLSLLEEFYFYDACISRYRAFQSSTPHPVLSIPRSHFSYTTLFTMHCETFICSRLLTDITIEVITMFESAWQGHQVGLHVVV